MEKTTEFAKQMFEPGTESTKVIKLQSVLSEFVEANMQENKEISRK